MVATAQEAKEFLIHKARSDVQIDACFEVMSELRPRLVRGEFVETVRWMMDYDNYAIAYGVHDGKIASVCGYRLATSLAYGHYLYVDDLVTAARFRSHGFGRLLLDWLKQEARDQLCDELHLDSGVHRIDAHRFYEREDLVNVSRHFAILLQRGETEG